MEFNANVFIKQEPHAREHQFLAVLILSFKLHLVPEKETLIKHFPSRHLFEDNCGHSL